MESFLRGNLQVQFGGRRASTLPYEYSDYNSSDEQSLTFDSYTIPEDDLELGQSRLLEVDNRVVLPAKSPIRFIVTSADVPHSWAVPSSGVKCDAVPGRLNQISILVQREGVYYGQCSEICGTNHAFMPIVVEAVPRKDYGSRVSNQLIPQSPDKEPVLVPSPSDDRTQSSSWASALADWGTSRTQSSSWAAALADWGTSRSESESSVNEAQQNAPAAAAVGVGAEIQPFPLLQDALRRQELDSRLSFHLHLIGKNWTEGQINATLEQQFLLEKQMESALLANGFSPESILNEMGKIRGIAFYPYGRPLAATTYKSYIDIIERVGPDQSPPYKRIITAFVDCKLRLRFGN